MATLFAYDRRHTPIDGVVIESARTFVRIEVVSDASASLVHAHAARCIFRVRTHVLTSLLLVAACGRQPIDDLRVGVPLPARDAGLALRSARYRWSLGRAAAREQQASGREPGPVHGAEDVHGCAPPRACAVPPSVSSFSMTLGVWSTRACSTGWSDLS